LLTCTIWVRIVTLKFLLSCSVLEGDERLCPRTKVFLLAGNRLLREALGRILRKREDILVVGESADSSDAVRPIVSSEADVLLMDCTTTTRRNFKFLSEVRLTLPDVQVVLVGIDEDETAFVNSIRFGVYGYLLKDASAADVLSAIRTVVQGEAVCPPRLCRALMKMVSSEALLVPKVNVKLRLGLTRREQELVPLIAHGLTNKEIASHLNLSEQTIKNHIHRMLRKLGADGRAGVVEIAQAQELAS